MIGAIISIFLRLSPLGPECPSFCPDSTKFPAGSITPSLIVHLKTVSTPSARLDRKLIERLPSASVADALRYLAGVQVRDYGGIGGLKTVNVRSLGAQHTSVFYNGIQICNAQNGQVDLGRFSLDNLETISLYKGHKADLLQPASHLMSASSVYLSGMVPERSGIASSLRTGAFGTVSPAVSASYVKQDLRMSASAEFLHSNGRYRFSFHENGSDTTAIRTNGDIRAIRSEANLAVAGFTLSAYGYASERGLPGPVIRRISDQYSSKDRQQDRTAFLQGSWRGALSETVDLLLSGKYGYDFCRYVQDPSKNAAVMQVDNRYRQNEAYLSAATAWRPAAWIGTSLAIDWRRNSFSGKCLYPAAAVTPSALRSALLASAQATLSPYEGWHIQGSMLMQSIRDRGTEAWKSRTRWTPAVMLSYEGLRHIRLRALYKETFRSPTFNELYYTIGGRPDLQPEQSRQIDAGLDATFSSTAVRLDITADAYMADITNKIVAIPAASQFRWSVINYGRVRARGTDLTVSAITTLRDTELSLRMIWNHEDSRDRTDRGSPWYGGRTAYSPLDSGSLTAGASHGGVSISASWIYTGKRFRDSANIPDNELKPWYTTDVSLSWQTGARLIGKIRVGIDLYNIFDQAYEVVSRYPMPGRHIMVKLNLTY